MELLLLILIVVLLLGYGGFGRGRLAGGPWAGPGDFVGFLLFILLLVLVLRALHVV